MMYAFQRPRKDGRVEDLYSQDSRRTTASLVVEEVPRKPRLSAMRLNRFVEISTILGLAQLSTAQVTGWENRMWNMTSKNSTKTPIPIIITNSCQEMIWPGIATQNGIGPGTGGFALDAGATQTLFVSSNWQGRVWGRTNCTFNEEGTGPINLNGVNGDGAACWTGDCFGMLDCQFTGKVPTTLAEFNLVGGINGTQTFYDISLVDGYNLPLAIVYHPSSNTSWIPPNLTNCACIASTGYLAEVARSGLVYTNVSFPVPWESLQTNSTVASWCPWDLQEYPPSKPGDGIYPYPDDNIQRPIFDPCYSACSATGDPQDCCTGEFNDPGRCVPSLYSENAKAVCPDAYSYAYDDQTSTFIVPSGGGWEIVFCPKGRSTNILEVFGDELRAVGAGQRVTEDMLTRLTDRDFIERHVKSSGVRVIPFLCSVMIGVLVVSAALFC